LTRDRQDADRAGYRPAVSGKRTQIGDKTESAGMPNLARYGLNVAAATDQTDGLYADTGSSGLRVGFVMEQILGHTTHYRTLRRVLERESDVVPQWVEVNYEGDGRLERTAWLPHAVRSTLRGYLQVRDGLRGWPADALLFHTQKPAVFQWDLMARIPTVLSLDVTPSQYDALGAFYDHAPDGQTTVARIKHLINRQTFNLARRIVVWSTWNRRSLVDDYGVPQEKIAVIPPGVDLDLWTRPNRTRAPGEPPRVLFVGGDFDRKGGRLLLDWFRTQGRDRCTLDLVTRAEITPEMGVRVFRDIVGNTPEARQRFFDADLFVLPSLGECFGIASIEAMAAGLPVIASRVGGTGDIVEDGHTGFLIEPNDPRDLGRAVKRLLDDAPLRRMMGVRGRARAERAFDAASNAHALLAVLHDAANVGSRRRAAAR
jgi:glycosyltransferase involved in cell wall biosynthesis